MSKQATGGEGEPREGREGGQVREIRAAMVLDGERRGVDEQGRFTAVANSGMVDRHFTVVEPEAMRKAIPAFRASSPRLLSKHGGGFMSIEPAIIGSVRDMHVEADGKTVFEGQYSNATEPARQWRKLSEDGHPGPFSIGFYGHEFESQAHPELNGRLIVHYTKIDLLEVSQVDTASDAQAVMRDAQALVAALREGKGKAPSDFDPLVKRMETLFEELRTGTREELERIAGDLLQRMVDRVTMLLDTRGPWTGDGADDGGQRRPGADDDLVGPELDPEQLGATLDQVNRIARGQ